MAHQFRGVTTAKATSSTSSPQISAIFFDLDNTLIPTRKGDQKACSKLTHILTNEHDLPEEKALQSTAQFLKTFRRCPDNPEVSLDKWRKQLWKQALPDSHKQLAGHIYEAWLHLRYKYLAPTAETIQMLQTLRNSYLLGIITNGPSNAQWEKIQKLNLNKLFDCILVSADLPWEKPDTQIFYAACNYLGVEPHNCLMVGDKLETDIQGGNDAKLGGTIWIPLVTADAADIDEQMDTTNPDYTINNLQQIRDLLPPDHPTSNQRTRCFRSRLSGAAGRVKREQYRRVTSLPDLDSPNSNSSDGS